MATLLGSFATEGPGFVAASVALEYAVRRAAVTARSRAIGVEELSTDLARLVQANFGANGPAAALAARTVDSWARAEYGEGKPPA